MSLTFTPSQPHGTVGPGLAFQITSNATAHATITSWQIELFQTVSPFAQIWTQQYLQTGGTLSARLGYSPGHAVQLDTTHDFYSDDTATLYAFAYDSTNTLVDFGNFDVTWEGREGIGALISLLPQTTSGLTSTQDTTLTETHNYAQAALSGVTMSLVDSGGTTQHTLGEIFSGWVAEVLTGTSISGGVTCDTVDYDASAKVISYIKIVIDSYPSDWYFTTPDGAWSPKDLAVLTIQRGGSDVYRDGIHTLSYQTQELPDIPRLPFVNNFFLTPNDYHILVSWAPGVCGEVIALSIP